MTENRAYIIIGGGNAGVSAAKAIRAQDPDGPLLILTKETDLPYRRPMLTKNFSAIEERNPYLLREPSYYAANKIEIATEEAVALDPEARLVRLASGRTLRYRSLVLATGANPFIPPFPGRERKNVLAIRTTADVRRLIALLKGASSAAVIGGGVLGIEAAWEMRKLGKEVAVIEAAPTLMRRNLDPESAALLMEKARAKGVEIILGGKTREIREDGVLLDGGRLVPAQVVVLSCGVRPETSLAREAGLSTGRGIVVDERMAASAEGVWACGDCAEFQGFCAGIWPVAGAMGLVAGANAAGGSAVYKPKAYSVMMKALDTGLFSAGRIEGEGLAGETVRTEGTSYRLFSQDGRLAGFVAIGDTSKGFALAALVESGAPAGEARRLCV